MIEILKDLADIFARLPEAALWIAGGILFYKLTIVGSIFGVIRLFISKLFSYLDNKENKPRPVSFDGIFLTKVDCYDRFISMLRFYRKERDRIDGSRLTFIHSDDVSFICDAVTEKLEKYEKEKNSK